jgi:uncharacterized protein (DUF849 family)
MASRRSNKIGRQAASNAEQVSKIVRIVRELGSDVATPSEARALLALKGKQAVRL